MSQKDIFSPEKQRKFWETVDPEAIELLQMFENRESWTLAYEETPAFYSEIADLIPDIRKFAESSNPTEEFLTKMAKILACMSLKNSVAALVWLDSKLENEITAGWGTIVYRHCEKLIADTDDADIARYARVVIERIQLMVRMNLLVSIFAKGGSTNA